MLQQATMAAPPHPQTVSGLPKPNRRRLMADMGLMPGDLARAGPPMTLRAA